MLVHIELSLGHALEVLYRCPAAIALALAGGKFRLNVDDALGPALVPHGSTLLRLMHPLPFNDGTDSVLGILVPKCVHSDILLEIIIDKRKVFPVFYFEALLCKQGEKRLEVMGPLLQGFVNGHPQNLTMGGFSLITVPLVVGGAATLRLFDNRQLMLGTNEVAEPCHGFAGPAEIPELPLAIKRDGVPIDVIVDMGFIGMGADKESVFAFEKTGSKIVADLICFLWRYFPWLKRLAHLVNEYIVLFFLSGDVLILPFGNQHLRSKGAWVTGVGGGQFSAICFFWI